MRNGLFVCRERERESEEGGNQRALVFCRFTVSTFFSFFCFGPFPTKPMSDLKKSFDLSILF